MPELESGRMMLLGAVCRDLIHATLGHEFGTRPTNDLDLALGLHTWSDFEAVADAFDKVADTGIRFMIGGTPVDIMPFGAVEEPTGTVEPPRRGEPLSVWAFDEIHAAALPLSLPGTVPIRMPTVAGYAAAKIGAWLDRSANGEYKDASDLAVIAYWYAESAEVADRLYDTETDTEILQTEEWDTTRAAVHLLGNDVIALIGPGRHAELLERWEASAPLLERHLLTDRGTHGATWPGRHQQAEVTAALTRGLLD